MSGWSETTWVGVVGFVVSFLLWMSIEAVRHTGVGVTALETVRAVYGQRRVVWVRIWSWLLLIAAGAFAAVAVISLVGSTPS